MSKIDFAEDFKKRTKQFAIDIIYLYRRLPKTEEGKIIGRQLIRAATSVASNYRAVCRARSDNEFYAKLSIVVEEADETVFWLEVISESEIYSVEQKLMKESNEILAVVSASRKTMKSGRTS
ncbi:MAG: four helix bundle protein [Bacteroidales bacterium]